MTSNPQNATKPIPLSSGASALSGRAPAAKAPVAHDVICNRETWLEKAVQELRDRTFAPAGYQVPTNVRVACSWPSRGGMGRKRTVLGQCWDRACSVDGHFEIFITPRLDDPLEAFAVLAHELVHVAVGLKQGHGPKFRACATAIGLEGRMTATRPGEAFKRNAAPILERLGPYPHGAILPLTKLPAPDDGDPLSTGPKRQATRMRKAVCSECGLTLRLTAKWINARALGCPDLACTGHDRRMQIS